MPAIIWYAIIAIVFAGGAAWVSRRVLDTPIGWVRSVLTGLVVFVAGTPLAVWALQSADVLDEGGVVAVDDALAALFLALTVGWMFAVVVVAIVTLEFLWPTRPMRNPIVVFREMFRRRDRARRYAQILAIASRHGLGIVRRHRSGAGDDLPGALVGALNEAGVTFIKIGQVLSSRDDVLPPELTTALSTLQMQTTPIPWSEARAAIEAQLHRPLEEVFAYVDETPLAAASVAQVHAATLRTGEEVVIKIQRPNARAQATTDLDIIERLAADAERRTDWGREYGAAALAAEFSRALREELDYRIEAANTEMLRSAVARSESAHVRIPAVYPAYSTAQMLVQERAAGVPLSTFDASTLDPEDATRIADGLLDAVFEQIAVLGVFHADLHPGNVQLAEDGTITLIDFGAVGVVEKSLRRMLLPLLVAMANEDDVAATDVVLLVVPAPELSPAEQASLQHDIGVILTRIHNARGDENIFRALIDVLRRHRLALPPSLLLVFRTLASLEGSLRRIRPGYDMVGRALERAPHFARRLVSPESLVMLAQTEAAIVGEQLRRAPRRIEALARQLEGGTFSMRMNAFEDSGERSWIEVLVGRLTTTLVGIALVIAAVVLGVSVEGPELTPDVPFYPFLGSLVGLGGLLLLLRSLREAFARRQSGR
ncbi:AarF/ABC1/UbiB kinase family protein [Microbacterium caowuchunii]|uniref:ABC1 kinase family protein n=1 Tax=Microbacterium caowuchunii TaxID=2614638 RepID=UPI001246F5DB|nr:AarF/UbiB family protein [Microbacterium caowuchunii]QEW01029.1 AarF/ABC1/UbiB kinase family protein [Microbacterium caowuchunii]